MINKTKSKLIKKKFNYKKNIFFENKNEGYVSNFGKQWKNHKKTQVDFYNNTLISKNLLDKVIFSEWSNLKGKNILEIGCGSGRFTQYLSILAKNLVVNDMSNAIWHNDFVKKKNIVGIKCDFKKLIELKIKYDVIFCRGVLQHTPDPLKSILKMYSMLNPNGSFYFDIYRKPLLGFLNSKYIWRKILRFFKVSYEELESFLNKNIDTFIKIRRTLNKVFFMNLNFIWDYFFPIYDYKNKLPLSDAKLREWSILDTLDGLLAYYDKPYTYTEVKNFLKKNKIEIKKFNYKYHSFKI
jgi:2-polyprenyl-3-methyl-5-hydroxy-6-metoxy-1,4-benzoquinol methylase